MADLKVNARRLVILIAFVAGIAASFYVYFTVRDTRTAEHREAVIHQADLHRTAIEEGLLIAEDLIYAMKGLFDSRGDVTREEFATFAGVLLQRADYIQALEWVPRVSDKQRAAFEARARAEGVVNYRFREQQDGKMVRAARRPDYFPVYYMQPFNGNEAAMGFDLGSNPARRAALELAADSGRAVMTAPVRLAQETGTQTGVLMFLPVYDGVKSPVDIFTKRVKLRGFVLLVLRVSDMINGSRRHLQPTVFLRAVDQQTGAILHDEIPPGLKTHDHGFHPIQKIGERVWQYEIRENPEYLGRDGAPLESLILAGLLAITGLSGLLMYQSERTNARITQQVAERTDELRRSRERFSLAADGASVGIWDWFNDRRGNAYFSPRFFNIIGIANAPAITSIREFYDRVHDDDKPAFNAALDEQKKHGGRLDHEVRIRDQKGNDKWIRVAATIKRVDGEEAYRRVGTVEDIHQRKVAEEQAEKFAEDLQRSNSELEQFVYVASHDLKAPLRGIRTLADWIEEELGDEAGEDTARYLDLLKSRVGRLDGLLEGLLAYARIGAEHIERETLDLDDLTDQICDLLDVDQSGFAVNHDLPVVHSSRVVLTQVLQNLIANAMKHHDKGKGIIDLTYRMGPDHYEISVTDDGPGIPKELTDRVFRMFQTLRPRDQVEGSGMGLAIVRKLLESIGGDIRVDTDYDGPGTRISFRVPIKADGGDV